MRSNPLAADLDHILTHTDGLWDELRGQHIFITGGTGFFGCWLLESFAWANDKLGLDASALVLTRNLDAFRKKAPHLASHPAIRFHSGDCKSFEFPTDKFSYVIHAATEAGTSNPVTLFQADLQGTRRILDFSTACGARKLLFTSSGAIYGKQPSELTHIPEDYPGAPSPVDLSTAYGHSKRISEFLCVAHAQQHGLQATIGRCFAFVGPHLPLDANYAIGNFTRDALRGGVIQIKADGTPYRSYLYAADLAIWLWTLLFRGQSGKAYNVGSDAHLTIAELAHLVAEVVNPNAEVVIAQQPNPHNPTSRYVPSIRRARTELGLEAWVDVRTGICRMAEWYQRQI
jgi:nucleoside-diphosphate-sugar epimerase